MSLKVSARTILRRLGVEVTGYRHTVPYRRQQLLDSAQIDLVLDVGANRGQYAKELRRGGYRGQIVSFEPLGAAYPKLVAAAAVDERWTTWKTAVGAEDGTLEINVSDGDDVYSSALTVAESTMQVAPKARQVSVEEVPLVRLDTLLPTLDISSTNIAVKIDVQGFERDVLLGAEVTLRLAKLVELEVSPSTIYEGQMLMPETIDRLGKLGFTLALTENLLPNLTTGQCMQFNGIFVRDQR